MAVYRSSAELDVKRSVIRREPAKLLHSLKREFGLSTTPNRIIAVDVAHISGADQVAASVSWANGRMDPAGARHWQSDSASEVGSMKTFVDRLAASRNGKEAELILIDGGPAQLNAALAAHLPHNTSIISAVKPQGEHESIAYFLTGEKRRVAFDMTNETHRLLQRLRDEAHDYANAIHRDTRDYANYYRLAEILPSLTESERRRLITAFGSIAEVSKATNADLSRILPVERTGLAAGDLDQYRLGTNPKIRPLVVPTGLQEEGAAAEDLRPIEASSAIKT